jgi:glucose/arabinose dehydrogenase
MRRAVAVLIGCLALLPSTGSRDAAAGLPRVRLESVLTGLASPLYVTSARDGSRRLFVVEQAGRIRVLQPGSASTTVFLDITDRILSGGERGLLGLAFHPLFAVNGRFFVNYTRAGDGATVIAEYRALPLGGNTADRSETILLTVDQPDPNHNGGMVEFGRDGFLYIALGDGGDANDPDNRAQNLDDLLGKILRIDVDRPDGLVPYSSPPDNPFFGPTPGRDEIYAYGLRNPFRFSFDRGTGALVAGDVGQNAREEVDVVVRGGNYGWRIFEGTLCNPAGDPGLCLTTSAIPPIVEYVNGVGARCAITGGYVYRGRAGVLPAGTYVYGDLCSGEIFMFQEGGSQALLLETSLTLASFGEDEDGEIYVVGLGGTVHRLSRTLTLSPASGHYVTTQVFDLVIILDGAVGVVAGGTATLDGVDIGGALASCVIPGTLAGGGSTFRCPGLTGGLLGPGPHTLTLSLDFSDGTSAGHSVIWEVRGNAEP